MSKTQIETRQETLARQHVDHMGAGGWEVEMTAIKGSESTKTCNSFNFQRPFNMQCSCSAHPEEFKPVSSLVNIPATPPSADCLINLRASFRHARLIGHAASCRKSVCHWRTLPRPASLHHNKDINLIKNYTAFILISFSEAEPGSFGEYWLGVSVGGSRQIRRLFKTIIREGL